MERDYELMYIARPDLDEEGLQGAVSSVEQLIAGAGGSVVSSTSWGRRRLAYEVDHLRDGHYMLLHVRLDGARVAGVERALAIHETVFRHLLVVREVPRTAEGEDGEATDGDGREKGEPSEPSSRQTPVAAAPEDEDAAGSADSGEPGGVDEPDADVDAEGDAEDDEEEN